MHGFEIKEQKHDEEEEEYQELDDEDQDPDYQPNADLETEFIAEDVEIEGDDDTFEIKKHVHAISL